MCGLSGSDLVMFFIIGALLYVLPTIIGVSRKCNNLKNMIRINLFLGWTVVGWLLAMKKALDN